MRVGRVHRVAILLATCGGLGLCVPAVATAAEVTSCAVNVETGAEACSPRMAAQRSLPAQVNGTVIIGKVFSDQDFHGASYTFTGSHPCKSGDGRDFNIRLAPMHWENRISSLQTWGNCWINLYSGANFDGQHDGEFKVDTPYIGPQLDKRTRSIGFD